MGILLKCLGIFAFVRLIFSSVKRVALGLYCSSKYFHHEAFIVVQISDHSFFFEKSSEEGFPGFPEVKLHLLHKASACAENLSCPIPIRISPNALQLLSHCKPSIVNPVSVDFYRLSRARNCRNFLHYAAGKLISCNHKTASPALQLQNCHHEAENRATEITEL